MSIIDLVQNTPIKAPTPWLQDFCAEGHAKFLAAGLPRHNQEEWRHTDIAFLATAPLRLSNITLPKITTLSPLAKATVLVFTNGHYDEKLSTTKGLPAGTILCDLVTALKNHPEKLKDYLVNTLTTKETFIHLNNALLEDGMFFYLPPNTKLSQPIHILHVSSGSNPMPMQQIRNVLVLAEGAEASLLEHYTASDDNGYFNNVVNQIILQRGATLKYCKLQQENLASLHIANTEIKQQAQSSIDAYHFAFGGSLARENINISLEGSYANCKLAGLYITEGKQHSSQYIKVEHIADNTYSEEFYKGILNEQSSASFQGRIIVHKGANKTDARQTNKNLLLTKEASVYTKPELIIDNDDVKCAHGATVGQVDANSLFYLCSRGIDQKTAMAILLQAFAEEIVTKLEDTPFASYIKQAFNEKNRVSYAIS